MKRSRLMNTKRKIQLLVCKQLPRNFRVVNRSENNALQCNAQLRITLNNVLFEIMFLHFGNLYQKLKTFKLLLLTKWRSLSILAYFI